jgi:hypothetical protein
MVFIGIKKPLFFNSLVFFQFHRVPGWGSVGTKPAESPLVSSSSKVKLSLCFTSRGVSAMAEECHSAPHASNRKYPEMPRFLKVL